MLDLTIGFPPSTVVILVAAVFLASMVRGFSGFGDALVYLPVAGALLGPVGAIMSFMIVAAIGVAPLVPSAVRTVDRNLAIPLNGMMLLTLPIGIYLLSVIEPTYLRLGLSLIAIGLAVLLFANWRPNIPTNPKTAGVLGALAGVIGGWSGVPGAIMMFYFLNSNTPPAQIRAQGIIVLFVFDITLFAILAATGNATVSLLILSAILLPFYVLGGVVGSRLFDPEKRAFYRNLSITVVFLSGIVGIPWGSVM